MTLRKLIASVRGSVVPRRHGVLPHSDERGFVLIGSLLILVLLVLIGIAATTSTSLELQIASAHRLHTVSFYQAEAGRSFAYASPALYGSSNVVAGEFTAFEAPAGSGFEFGGRVLYDGPGALPRGSGFSDDFSAHYYRIRSTGTVSIAGAEAVVEAGGYRVGF